MESRFSLIEGGAELLARVKPLWLEHRAYNAQLWPIWQASFLNVSFEARQERLLAKCQQGLLVLLASIEHVDVAYCVCSVDNRRIGEIDSIYVQSDVRRNGIGTALISRAIEWFNAKGTNSAIVEAMRGNDPAISFYERHGFRPRTIRLVRTID